MLAYNDTLYSNSRKICQRFEMYKDIYTLHNGTGKTNTIGIAAYWQRPDKENALHLIVCKQPLHIKTIKGYYIKVVLNIFSCYLYIKLSKFLLGYAPVPI